MIYSLKSPTNSFFFGFFTGHFESRKIIFYKSKFLVFSTISVFSRWTKIYFVTEISSTTEWGIAFALHFTRYGYDRVEVIA